MAAAAENWLGTDLETVGFIVLSTIGIYVAVIVLARLRGLRSFSKMSAFDIAMAVAMGTILATTAMSSSVSLPEGVLAAATFFGAHTVVSALRQRRDGGRIVDNQPKLLAKDGRLIEGALREVGMTEDDLAAKLRLEGIASLEQTRLVVMETTGDVSVIRSEAGEVSGLVLRGVED